MQMIESDKVTPLFRLLLMSYPKDVADEMCENIQEIVDAHTIDSVPVVRCKDCVNVKCIDEREGVYTCTHPQWTRKAYKDTYDESRLFHGLEANDFCSYGERKPERCEG